MLALRAGFAVRAARVGQQRKVTRSPAGEWKLLIWLVCKRKTRSNAFVRYAAEFISFVNRQKKRNQRKTIPRRSSPTRHSFRHFPTRHPGSVGKRRASMPAALRVFDVRGCVTEIKSGWITAVLTPTPRTGTPIPAPSAPSHPAHSARASCAAGGCARRPCVPRRRRCRPRRGRAAASGCRRVRGGS